MAVGMEFGIVESGLASPGRLLRRRSFCSSHLPKQGLSFPFQVQKWDRSLSAHELGLSHIPMLLCLVWSLLLPLWAMGLELLIETRNTRHVIAPNYQIRWGAR